MSAGPGGAGGSATAGSRPVSATTAAVRQELASDLPTAAGDRLAMLTGIVRVGGSLQRRGADDGGHLRIVVTSRSGAVARATFRLLEEVGRSAVAGDVASDRPAPRPELAVHAPGGVRTAPTYEVAVDGPVATAVARRTGMIDRHGRPGRELPTQAVRTDGQRRALLRGALLVRGSISGAGRAPHLEIPVPTREIAATLAEVIGGLIDHGATVSRSGDAWRVVLKSRAAIGQLLGTVGATDAYLAWEEAGVRRQVRRAANRLANADAANLRRAVDAAAAQVRAVERAVAGVGWEQLDDDLRQVALARLTNPEASLAELGALCDPPVGKSAVHRRLVRLEAMADEVDRPPS